MVENVGRAKTRKKPRISKPDIENKKQYNRNAGQKRQLASKEALTESEEGPQQC
jgi:hypothetical protein